MIEVIPLRIGFRDVKIEGGQLLVNGRPVLIAPSTNDGLAGSAPNLGALLNRRYIYFVPFGQDDPVRKPASLVADFSQVADAAQAALEGRQLQPLLTVC